MDPLPGMLGRIRRRLLAVRALEAGLAGAIGGAALAAVGTVLRILVPQAMPQAAAHPLMPMVLVPAGFVAAAIVRLASGATLREAALAADRAAGLRERLATALEVLDARPGGALDALLLEQARAAAGAIEPARLRLAVSMGRRTRILLVAMLVLAIGAFVPPLGGPAVPPQAAEAAAETLRQAAAPASVASGLRQEIERAIDVLRRDGARQGGAAAATEAVYEAAARARQARGETLKALAGVSDPDVRRIAQRAAQGDAAGASAAAADLADRLGPESGSGGMAPADRERLADGLSGAAPAAARGGMTDLAKALAAAAEAVRRADPKTGEALGRMAGAMTEALGAEGAGGVAAVVDAVAQARRTLGLPEAGPAESAPSEAAPAAVPGAGPAVASPGESPASVAGGGETATGGAAGSWGGTAPDAVRPEDREVVRRYFGG